SDATETPESKGKCDFLIHEFESPIRRDEWPRSYKHTAQRQVNAIILGLPCRQEWIAAQDLQPNRPQPSKRHNHVRSGPQRKLPSMVSALPFLALRDLFRDPLLRDRARISAHPAW